MTKNDIIPCDNCFSIVHPKKDKRGRWVCPKCGNVLPVKPERWLIKYGRR
jgi:DNA-directed RNA polymerase subunit M/transcription elongation factor TFIIS